MPGGLPGKGGGPHSSVPRQIRVRGEGFDRLEHGMAASTPYSCMGARLRGTQVLQTCCMDGPALAAAVCGAPAPPHLSARDVRRAFMVAVITGDADEHHPSARSPSGRGEGGRSPSDGINGGGGGALALAGRSEAVVAELLWEVLDGWGPELVGAFLKFTTGSDRCAPRCGASGQCNGHSVASVAGLGIVSTRALAQLKPRPCQCKRLTGCPRPARSR